jgi:PEP-CTERM motif
VSRLLRSGVAAFAAATAIFVSTDAARALCIVPTASYQGGAYGAYAVTEAGECASVLDQNGGTGSTTAAASSSYTPEPGGDSFLLSSTANLTSGVLTADSQIGFASSSIWDSFTYTGLPAGGATITATLSLPGTLTGGSDGFAFLEEGTQTDFTDGGPLVYSVFFNTTGADAKPSSIPLSFTVTDGDPVIVFAEIQAGGDGMGGVADLGDPPTLTLTLPENARVTTASGVFDNFVSTTVPEPSTWAMMLLGFVGLGFFGYRRTRTPVSTA